MTLKSPLGHKNVKILPFINDIVVGVISNFTTYVIKKVLSILVPGTITLLRCDII